MWDPVGVSAVVGAEEALEAADEAWSRADLEACVVHLSAAIRALTVANEDRRAAMACVRLGSLYANAMGNLTVSRAWFARARRLVQDEPPCLEQGWVAVAAIGCDVDDPAELLANAELALDRGRRFGDVNLETKALADGGLALVQAGRVADGMAMLDEAMALACGPADVDDPVAMSVCSFFTACYHAADFGRAGSWTDVLRRRGLMSLDPGFPVFLSSHCDSVQATLLVELGLWSEAEAILVRAKSAFESAMRMPSWHPDIALADLRIKQGRLAEAEALLLGKDQSVQALLPMARLHLARGDHELAQAVARRGLRAVGDDCLRAIELLTTLIDAELAAGDLDGAVRSCGELTLRAADLDVMGLRARGAAACARVRTAAGAIEEAVEELERAVDGVDAGALPWLWATLHVELARRREQIGDLPGAAADAFVAAAILPTLDVVVAPGDAALLDRLGSARSAAPRSRAVLARDGTWWTVSCGGTTARLRGSKGLRYLAELLVRPGSEHHVLDLVDRIEGVAPPGGPDRRALGDAGEVLDSRARADYRKRIEALRAQVDEALAADMFDTAEAMQDELDQLVAQLAGAFGLDGRSRRAGSTVERARLNVTRAIRSAVANLEEAIPAAGPTLGRRVRTGVYCAYEPDDDGFTWVFSTE